MNLRTTIVVAGLIAIASARVAAEPLRDASVTAACARADDALVRLLDQPPVEAKAWVQAMKTVLAELQCPEAPASCRRIGKQLAVVVSRGDNRAEALKPLRDMAGLYRELPCDPAALSRLLAQPCAEAVRRFEGRISARRPWFEAIEALADMQMFHCSLGPLLEGAEAQARRKQ